MKCHDCEAWIDCWLDARASRPCEPAGLHDHLGECRACRERYQAAQRLLDGVKALPRVTPTPGLTERIVQAALADRVLRRRRLTWRLSFTAALAASIVIMLIGGYFWSPGPKKDDPVAVKGPSDPPAPAAPVLAEKVDEAKGKVAAPPASYRVDHGARRHLLAAAPVLEFRPGEGVLPQEPIDATAPLRQAGAELMAGLQPVTRSARRAMDFLLREISTFEVKQ